MKTFKLGEWVTLKSNHVMQVSSTLEDTKDTCFKGLLIGQQVLQGVRLSKIFSKFSPDDVIEVGTVEDQKVWENMTEAEQEAYTAKFNQASATLANLAAVREGGAK